MVYLTLFILLFLFVAAFGADEEENGESRRQISKIEFNKLTIINIARAHPHEQPLSSIASTLHSAPLKAN